MGTPAKYGSFFMESALRPGAAKQKAQPRKFDGAEVFLLIMYSEKELYHNQKDDSRHTQNAGHKGV